MDAQGRMYSRMIQGQPSKRGPVMIRCCVTGCPHAAESMYVNGQPAPARCEDCRKYDWQIPQRPTVEVLG